MNIKLLDQGEPMSSDGGESCQYCDHHITSAGSQTCDTKLAHESFFSYCSREKGHQGPHVSCSNGQTIDHAKHVWPNDDEPYGLPGYTAVNKKPPQREEACSKCKWYHILEPYYPMSGQCRINTPQHGKYTSERWPQVLGNDFCGNFTAAHPKANHPINLTDTEKKESGI